MFETYFFIYLNFFLRILFERIIIFLLFYYVMSLPYPSFSFLDFFVSPSFHIVSPWPYPYLCFLAQYAIELES